MSEMALLRVKKSRLKLLAKEGNKSAKNTLSLIKNPPEMLSTIQVGITLVGIFTGVFSGATISQTISSQIAKIEILKPYSMAISILFVVLVITYFIVVLGELLPKQIGLSDPEKISMKATKPIKIFMKINKPLVRFLSKSTRFFMKLFGISPAKEEYITEDEVKLLIAEGTKKGNFEKGEKRIIERVLFLGNLSIKRFITPKEKLVWLDINDSLKLIQKKITQSDKSVFPVFDGGLENIVGAVEVKDILAWTFQNPKHFDLKSLLQPLASVPARTPALLVIEKLRKSNISIMLITGKNKHEIIGIVSFHDILEALVGSFKEDNS